MRLDRVDRVDWKGRTEDGSSVSGRKMQVCVFETNVHRSSVDLKNKGSRQPTPIETRNRHEIGHDKFFLSQDYYKRLHA